jgi:hypothetical protein
LLMFRSGMRKPYHKCRCYVERSETSLAISLQRIDPEMIRDSSPATAGSE